jgi:Na+-transporting NADH:ubiquinone oxidoreductase subunit NqrF
MKKEATKNITDKGDNMDIGENTFLKLREQRDQARLECDQVKIQRDIALRKLNKALQIAKDLRKLIENGNQTK